MEIWTFKSQASNILADKGNYVCCHKGSTDKDLRRICRNQYGHPGPAIGYWPEKSLGLVYVILEPVGSPRLTFVDDIILYELCMLVTECCSESRMRSRTWRGAPEWSKGKDWYMDNSVRSSKRFRNSPEGVTDVSRNVWVQEHFIWAKGESPRGFWKVQ